MFLSADKFSLFVFQDVLSQTSQIRQISQLPYFFYSMYRILY